LGNSKVQHRKLRRIKHVLRRHYSLLRDTMENKMMRWWKRLQMLGDITSKD